MTTVPEQTLATIWIDCMRLIDVADDALAQPLCDEQTADSPEARTVLTGAKKAAANLLQYLNQNYDFSTGYAEPKEETTWDA